ncbi:hypothetical protein G6F60_014799 [Rhizopus arrhizus]|nr:hypothetical protein G6F60_014799 [Rhizopus arrhizus]
MHRPAAIAGQRTRVRRRKGCHAPDRGRCAGPRANARHRHRPDRRSAPLLPHPNLRHCGGHRRRTVAGAGPRRLHAVRWPASASGSAYRW